jgi:nicotinate-nucleotide pyrophosphorylase (carboxylating)
MESPEKAVNVASEIERNVSAALAEDVGAGDWTALLTPEGTTARATVLCRSATVLCGQAWFDLCFRKLDPHVQISWSAQDGDNLAPDAAVCAIEGKTRALLTGERCALNFLQTLSAVATATRRYVDTVAGTRAAIVDTRKTLPGLRLAQKYAVRTGGGLNHRLGHMVPDEMRQAVQITAGRAQLEASGGITLENVRAIAETGVDRISIGSLTKDIKAADLSMRFVQETQTVNGER